MGHDHSKILVAIDGSDQSFVATQKAAVLASQFDSELIIISVVNDFSNMVSEEEAEQIYEYSSRALRDDLERFEKAAKSLGANRVSRHVIKGDPRHAIIDFANEHDVGLIVIAATGKGRVQRALLGSVSEYVMHHAKCDVYLCHKV